MGHEVIMGGVLHPWLPFVRAFSRRDLDLRPARGGREACDLPIRAGAARGFFGSLGASLFLSVFGAFRGWRLSHFLAAVAIVSGLPGGSVAVATLVLLAAAIVSLAAAKIVQWLFHCSSTSASSQDADSALAETGDRSVGTKGDPDGP